MGFKIAYNTYLVMLFFHRQDMASFALQLWFSFTLLLWLFLRKLQVPKQRKRFPPGPPKLPVTGNLHQVSQLLPQSLHELAKKYGPVMQLQLGAKPVVVISSADAAREVLKDHDLDCCTRPRVAGITRLSYNHSDMAFAPYGDGWREIRKICVLDFLTLRRVQSFQPLREKGVKFLVDSISQLSSSGTPVNLDKKLISFTGRVISDIIFGRSSQGAHLEDDQCVELVHECMVVFGSLSASEYFPIPPMASLLNKLTGYHRRQERTFHQLDTLLQKVIDDHLDPGNKKEDQDEDIIDMLLREERDQTKLGAADFTMANVKGVLMNLYTAGIDTSAATLIWAMSELARKPEVMKKVQDEVRGCVGREGKVSESDLRGLSFLKMVIKETLRLHPPAPLLLPREAMTHFTIQGYDIYPKTMIQVNAWAIGRDPKYWNNPEEFNPQRFTDKPIDYKGQHFEFLPFGSGRRTCPGINMGITLVELSLANLLYHFDWNLPGGIKEEDIDVEEEACPSLSPSKNTALHLIPVKHFEKVI